MEYFVPERSLAPAIEDFMEYFAGNLAVKINRGAEALPKTAWHRAPAHTVDSVLLLRPDRAPNP